MIHNQWKIAVICEKNNNICIIKVSISIEIVYNNSIKYSINLFVVIECMHTFHCDNQWYLLSPQWWISDEFLIT